MKGRWREGWRKYLGFVRKATTFQVKIIFTLLYFLLFPPLVLFVKRRRRNRKSNWRKRTRTSLSLEDMRREY